MANYPSIDIEFSSTRKPKNATKVDVSSDGTVRGRTEYSKTVYDFNIEHLFVTAAEKDEIIAFYHTNKNTNFTYNYAKDGQDYTLQFLGEPDADKVTPIYWNVITTAVGSLL